MAPQRSGRLPVLQCGHRMDDRHADRPVAVLFDVDETLVSTGGAGARAWRSAFAELWDVEADITRYTAAGMTDPEVGRITFEHVLGRPPDDRDMARLLAGYLGRLPEEVAAYVGLTVDQLDALRAAERIPVSLETRVGSDGDTELGALLPQEGPSPFDELEVELAEKSIHKALKRSSHRQ